MDLLYSIVRSEVRFCEDELCCLAHRRKLSALSLLDEYLNHFVAVRNTRASAVLGELAWWFRAAELISTVGRFCLLLFVYGTCCRRACLVVAL